MELNVMAGRALFGRFQLPDGLRRCAIFLVQEKVMQGTSRAADYRAYRRIAPKSLELVVVPGLSPLPFVDDCWCSSQQGWSTLTLHEIGRSQSSSTQPSLYYWKNLHSLATLEVDVNCSCLRRPTRHGSH